METLSFGFQKPDDGDKGPTLWAALLQNIQQLNDHTHNGSDSTALNSSALVAGIQALDPSNWASYGGPIGHYRQIVTCAPGYTFDNFNISFRTASGAFVYPTVERLSATSFYLYSTDNTLGLVAIYGG